MSTLPDHILMVVWENTDYNSLIGNISQAPYLNGLLSQGVLFTNYHAVDHPSEGNYIAMFSGGDQGLTTDTCPQSTGAENVFHLLANASKTYLGYMEDLPSVGYTGCANLNYVRRHNASIQFTNVNANTSVPWTQFPSDYTTLPALSVVIPNLQHDLHDGTMAQADTWLQTNLDGYIQWCKTHNSLFIFTIDESATGGAASQVPLLIIGQGVNAATTNTTSYDHTNLSSTLSSLYGLPSLGPADIIGWYTYPTLAADTFQRPNVASSWGTSIDGHPWTIVAQPVGTVQVSAGVGQALNSNVSGINLLIGSASRTDTEVLVKFSLSNVNAACHPILRYQSTGNFYYAGQDISGNLAIKKRVNDVGTQLVASANVLTANQKYWVRFRVQGTTLSLRFWQDGNTEPGTWNLQVTDTTYTAGAVGQRNTCASTTDTVSIYSYQVADLTSTARNQLSTDTFTRVNQSGLGTSSDGELWVAKDANATYSIVSNRGQATGFSTSSNIVLGGTAQYDTDMTVRFSTSVPITDALFFIARWTNLSNFYYIGFVQNQLSVRKVAAGTTTTVTSTAFTTTASTNYWLHVIVQGTNIKVKAWQSGSGEPTAWNITLTDSSLTEGSPGLRFFGGASDIVLVDSFAVNVPASSSSQSVTRSNKRSIGRVA